MPTRGFVPLRLSIVSIRIGKDVDVAIAHDAEQQAHRGRLEVAILLQSHHRDGEQSRERHEPFAGTSAPEAISSHSQAAVDEHDRQQILAHGQQGALGAGQRHRGDVPTEEGQDGQVSSKVRPSQQQVCHAEQPDQRRRVGQPFEDAQPARVVETTQPRVPEQGNPREGPDGQCRCHVDGCSHCQRQRRQRRPVLWHRRSDGPAAEQPADSHAQIQRQLGCSEGQRVDRRNIATQIHEPDDGPAQRVGDQQHRTVDRRFPPSSAG